MKLPKFIKSSQSQTQSSLYKKKSAGINTSILGNGASAAQQLLLTDEICRFQPQKNKIFLEESSCKLRTPTKAQGSLVFQNLVLSNNASTGRYTKSNAPKRLQRNKHVSSKPANYELRSSLNINTPVLVSLF